MFKEILGCDQPHALPGRPGGTTEAGSQGLGAMRVTKAVTLVQRSPPDVLGMFQNKKEAG